MRVAFLLGSGICVDAAMPSVTEISEQVFSGVGAVRHIDPRLLLSRHVTMKHAWPLKT